MKWLGRILWLLFGLLWRLVVLLLFEKWVPFPQHEQVARPAPPPSRKKKRRARDGARPGAASQQAARSKRAEPPPFFTAQSSELSPELAAQREGEHWLKVGRARQPQPARGERENLAGLLRDRRALRDAVVLGAALAPRPKS